MKRIFCIQKGLPIASASVLIVFVLFFCAKNLYAQDAEETAKQKAFEQFFGDAAVFDPVMVEKVKSGTPGKRYYVDKNNDGKPEEVWFIDIDPRHTEAKRPILVKVIDEDGDLEMGKEPDRDSDLWIADWNANGMVDAVISYKDMDHDQDMDRMEWYFYGKKNRHIDNDGLRVILSIDDGDDNLLDYDIDYVYYQTPCQNHSHFGGDESFTTFYLDSELNKWVPYWENPFLFYDLDNDGVTEEVVRIEGKEELVKYLRWSFDADNDGTTGQPRDFDVGITALATGWTREKDRQSDFNMYLGEGQTETFMIRGVPTGPVLSRSVARDFLQTVTWSRVLMTWDENDLNMAWNQPSDTIERWEGIIAAASDDEQFYMPQIGGPDCGPFNKRYELVLRPTGPNEFYFNPSDHRIHIKNSDRTWIKVDYDYDLKEDMNYLWIDSNKDGIMDRINIDVDGDGKTDDSYNMDVSEVKSIKWTFADINSVNASVLKTEPESRYLLVNALTSALESVKTGIGADSVWNMINNKMRYGNISQGIATRLVDSDETLLYYLTLVQDRQIARLKTQNCGSKSFWRTFNTARTRGNTEAMTDAVRKEFKIDSPEEDYVAWVNRLRKRDEKPHVAWDNLWLPPNWGWESEKAAFRFYEGHFDLFGKRLDTLIYPGIAHGKSYHLDQNGWGMDILHVGNTSGCGGLILYVNGIAYPVRIENKPGDPTFTCRLLDESSDKVTLEFIAEGVGPKEAPYTVRIRPSALAGRFDSPVEVVVKGGAPGDKTELGIGLVRLPEETFFSDEHAGIMGTWGFQQPEIGWIGMGVIFPSKRFLRFDEQKEEHRVILQCEPGTPLVYYIRGDWLRGHRFSCCLVAKDWMDTLKKTAGKTFQ